MSSSRVVSTTATTKPIPSISGIASAISSSYALVITATTTVLPPGYQNEVSLLHDSIIIASTLGGFAILLIAVLTLIYCLLKRREHQHELSHSPPFTALAAPPRQRSTPIPPEELHDTSLSRSTGVHVASQMKAAVSAAAMTDATQQHHHRRADHHRDPISPLRNNPPAIFLQPSPSPPISASVPSAIQGRVNLHESSRAYHDVRRSETELEVPGLQQQQQQQSWLDPMAGTTNTANTTPLRPLSGVSDISDIDAGQGGGTRTRSAMTSTRASSGVFPDD